MINHDFSSIPRTLGLVPPPKTSKFCREWMVGIQAGFSAASTHVNICTTRQIQQNSTNQNPHATPCPKFPRLKVWLPEAEVGRHKTPSCLRSNQPLLWQRPWDKPWGWAKNMEWDGICTWCKSTIEKGGQPNNSNMHMLIQSMLYQEFMFLHGGNIKVKKIHYRQLWS